MRLPSFRLISVLLLVCLNPLPLVGQDSGVVNVGGFLWTTSDRGVDVDWRGAAAYCGSLTLAARSDWRLPTTTELLSIYDPNSVDASGKGLMGPFREGVTSNWIWTADRADESNAFVMDFKTGSRTSLPTNFAEGAHSLCVAPAGSASVGASSGTNAGNPPAAVAAAPPARNVAPPAAPPAGAAAVSAAQIQELLSAHNRWRAAVGVPQLKWSNAVAAGAQEWANRLAASGTLQHASSGFGENLFSGSGVWTATQAVDDWGSEKAECNYNGEAIGDRSCTVGHYTQMVWRKTTELGCGVATTTDGGTVWVCRYDPPGNMIGEKPY